MDPDYILIIEIGSLVLALGYVHTGDLWDTFKDEYWLDVSSLKIDPDVVNLINRYIKEMRRVLNVYVEHVNDETEIIEPMNPLLALIGLGPSQDERDLVGQSLEEVVVKEGIDGNVFQDRDLGRNSIEDDIGREPKENIGGIGGELEKDIGGNTVDRTQGDVLGCQTNFPGEGCGDEQAKEEVDEQDHGGGSKKDKVNGSKKQDRPCWGGRVRIGRNGRRTEIGVILSVWVRRRKTYLIMVLICESFIRQTTTLICMLILEVQMLKGKKPT